LVQQPARRRQFLILRGTETPADLIRDASVTPQYYADLDTDLHVGFAAAARQVFNRVHDRLRPDEDIVLVGHSMGGAMAGILSLFVLKEAKFKPEQITIYTFGQPMYGVCVCETHRVKYLRFVNSKDPIPTVPPVGSAYLGVYRHFNPAIYLWNNGEWSYVPERGARKDWSTFARIVLKTDLQLHSMSLYISRLQNQPGTLVEFNRQRYDQG
ncbi:MAG TPA: lipase family protein, partial [bacterium]|nr:lipase family protein [bacterium]